MALYLCIFVTLIYLYLLFIYETKAVYELCILNVHTGRFLYVRIFMISYKIKN